MWTLLKGETKDSFNYNKGEIYEKTNLSLWSCGGRN